MVAAGEGPTGKSFGGGGTGGGAAAIGGVGLARAAGAAGLDVQEAAEDERYLRQVKTSRYPVRSVYVSLEKFFKWCTLHCATAIPGTP